MKKIILLLIITSFTFVTAQDNKKKPVDAKKSAKEAKSPKDTSAKEPAPVDNVTTEPSPAEAKSTEAAKESLPVEPTKSAKEEIKAPEKTPEPEVAPPAGKTVAAPPAFKGPNLIHMPTAQPLQKDILNFIFNHRFGNAKSTEYDFFGLDKGANTQLSLDYGLTDKLSIGFSRVTAFKTYEARSKYFLVPQTNSFPVSIAVFGSVGVETEKQTANMGPYILPPSSGYPVVDEALKKKLNSYELTYSDRTSYLGSVLISRDRKSVV